MATSNFPVRVGRLVKWVSALGCVLLFGLALMFHRITVESLQTPDWMSWLQGFNWISWSLIALPLICLLFTVRGYRIDGGTLYVRRLLHETAIDLRDLSSAETVPRAFDRALRVFGNGGLFSFSGWFWRRGFGFFKVYAMDIGPGLMLRWPGKAVVLTPVDPEAMAARLQARISPSN